MEIYKKLRITPRNYDLYRCAITHRSYTHQKNEQGDYQRLEFLGDAVISKIVAEHLYKLGNLNEGDMSKARNAMVQCATLARACTDIGIAQEIRIGTGTPITDKIVEDVFEAFCGALYLDQGERKVKEILDMTILAYYRDKDLHAVADHKTRLQESLQAQGMKVTYRMESDGAKTGVFTATVMGDGVRYGTGSGATRRAAEQKAAEAALAKLGEASAK